MGCAYRFLQLQTTIPFRFTSSTLDANLTLNRRLSSTTRTSGPKMAPSRLSGAPTIPAVIRSMETICLDGKETLCSAHWTPAVEMLFVRNSEPRRLKRPCGALCRRTSPRTWMDVSLLPLIALWEILKADWFDRVGQDSWFGACDRRRSEVDYSPHNVIHLTLNNASCMIHLLH